MVMLGSGAQLWAATILSPSRSETVADRLHSSGVVDRRQAEGTLGGQIMEVKWRKQQTLSQMANSDLPRTGGVVGVGRALPLAPVKF